MKMAGHLGNSRITVSGLQVLGLDKETHQVLVSGSVPGPIGGVVLIKKSHKKAKAYHEPEIPTLPHVGGDELEGKSESEDATQTTSESKAQEAQTKEDSAQPEEGETKS
jgi:hypothetical protein